MSLCGLCCCALWCGAGQVAAAPLPDDGAARGLSEGPQWAASAERRSRIGLVLSGGGADIMTDLAILKRNIKVVRAADVGRHDIEWVALELIARQDAG